MVFQEYRAFVYDGAVSCSDCSRVTSPSVIAATALPMPTFDVSESLDGAIVASDAFRDVCVDVPGVSFAPLDDLGGYSLLEVGQVVRIDQFDSRIRYGPICTTCDRPRYVTRSGPIRLESDEDLPRGFSCSEMEFGDSADFGPDQPIRFRPLVLVDRTTARLLKSAPILGVHLIAQP